MLKQIGSRFRTLIFSVAVLTTTQACGCFSDYYKVEAEVLSVKELCTLNDTEHYGVAKKRTETDETPCSKARRLVDTDPRYKDFKIFSMNYVDVRYQARGEERRRTETIRYPSDPPRSGETVTVQVLEKQPDFVMRDGFFATR